MAKGTATCMCETCGNEFEVEKTCYNRRDADQWEEWASAHYCECPSCYRKRMAEEAKKEAEAMNLPEIVAVSEKQKKFAEDMRAKYINRNKADVKYVRDMLATLDVEAVRAIADKKGKTVDEIMVDAFAKRCLDRTYIILTSTEARKIIDLAR